MIIIEEIKEIIYKYIEEEYQKHLKSNNLLLIKDENLNKIITNLYDNNIKNIKKKIREDLKNKYKDKYPSGSVENVLLDFFQDKNLNINKTCDELRIIQNNNYIELKIPIINNSLNLNISIINSYIIINSANKNNIENYDTLYETVNKYKFIYSINDKILDDYIDSDKIKIIKEEINNQEEIKIGLYYKK